MFGHLGIGAALAIVRAARAAQIPVSRDTVWQWLAITVALVGMALVVQAKPSAAVSVEAAEGEPFIGIWSGGSDAEAETMDDLGVGWGRVTVRWVDVEPRPGVYTWASLDQAFVNASGDGRRQLLVTIRNNPAWAAARRCTITNDTERANLARFVEAVVRRYSGTIPDGPLAGRPIMARYWQFYNEMDYSSPELEATIDLGGCFATSNDRLPTHEGRDHYARMIEAVGPAVRATDPNGKVVMGGVASSNYLSRDCPLARCPFDPGFIKAVVQTLRSHGTLDRLDAVAVHYYSSQSVFWSAPGAPDLVGRVAATRQMMREAGLTTAELKPIFVDEGSYTDGSPNSTNDPNEPYNRGQKAYIPKVLARAAYANVAGYLWFKREDTLGPGLGGDWPFGLIDGRGAAKPAYGALRHFASLVRSANQVTSRLTFASPKLEGYELVTNDGRRLQIVWNEADNTPEPFTPSFGIGGTITDPLGVSTPPTDRTIMVGAEPRFVYAPICTPRPPIRLTTIRDGRDRLQVTVSATITPGVPNNRISQLRFENGTNSLVDIPDHPSGATGRFDATPPVGATSYTFTVRRFATGQSVQVPFTVVDGCGPWPTFVGGGRAAF
jgi:hypothetical protein